MKIGRMGILALTIGLFFQAPSAALRNVLHYYFCSFPGFGCGDPESDTLAFQQMSETYGFKVKHTRDSSDLIDAAKYDLVVFDNAGDAGGMRFQNQPTAPYLAFKEYMEAGGRFLGLNGTSDTRNLWDWFDTALFSGAYFNGLIYGQTYFYRDTSSSTPKDPALERMWKYAEDSLGIVTGAIRFSTSVPHLNIDVAGMPGVRVLQEVRGKDARNGIRETTSWVKILPGGGRMLYCGLGRPGAEWTSDDGWLKKATYAYMRYLVGDFDAGPTALAPAIRAMGSRLEIRTGGAGNIRVTDTQGRLVASGPGSELVASRLKPGVYIVTYGKAGALSSRTLVVP